MTESSSLDRVIVPSTNLTDAIKCVLVSFDSTICSNLSAGMPIEGIEIEINHSIFVGPRRRWAELRAAVIESFRVALASR